MKWKLFAIALALAVLLPIAHFLDNSRTDQPLSSIVSELGPPTFLAQATEIYRRKGKILRIDVLEQDPRTIQDWHSVTNKIAIWASDRCKDRAELFFNSLKTDPDFDGTGWFTSTAWFGEKLAIATVNERGVVSSMQNARRIASISIRLVGVSGPAVYGLRGNDRVRINAIKNSGKQTNALP